MPESKPSSSEQKAPPTAIVPTAAPAGPSTDSGGRSPELDPTRYGDWEKNGRCIDF